MQHDNGRLKIHTNVRPEESAPCENECVEQSAQALSEAAETSRVHPGDRQVRAMRGKRRRRKDARRECPAAERLTAGERLVRNTAVACALLLSVMALRNVDHPWSVKATEGIRQAMTMRVDWDDTLGRLSFVRALVPDTALVFFNMGSVQLNRPVDGQVVHEYSQQQPWVEYACSGAQPVCAVAAGQVKATGQGAGDDWIVMIGDDEGREAVYGYLNDVCVRVGQEIKAGQQIGSTADGAQSRLYFELREEGRPVNPSDRMR